jgi:DNA-directed RNA polymerase, mitochondrial
MKRHPQDEALDSTVERHAARRASQLKRGGESATDEGRTVLGFLLPILSQYIAGPDKPRPPLGLDFLGQLDPDEVALAALAPLMNFIAGTEPRGDEPHLEVRISMGASLNRALYMKELLREEKKKYRHLTKKKRLEILRDYRRVEWMTEQKYLAGNWLLDCCIKGLDPFEREVDLLGKVFELDSKNVPQITDSWREHAAALCADLEIRSPVFPPSTEPLRPWTDGRSGGYLSKHDVISMPFVRGHRADHEAVEAAFKDGTMREHVDGVNGLQDVWWKINRRMLPVVKQFAGEDRGKMRVEGPVRRVTIERKIDERRRIIARDGLAPDGGGVGKRVSPLLVAKDVARAEELASTPFCLPYSCDFRGRLYPVPYFNYSRADYMRSLLLFENGLPINTDDGFSNFKGIELLMMHAANCADFGRISKKPFGERVEWAWDNRALIKDIAADPIGAVKEWRDPNNKREKPDKHFSFVAACFELAEAWKDPDNFVTHLPVTFDATCSGIQHLVMMTGDEVVGRMVNLIPGEDPQDVYLVIHGRVVERIEREREGPSADKAAFWLDVANLGDIRTGRKLTKGPGMTFAYSATVSGMTEQVLDAWDDLPSKHNQPPPTWEDRRYLASHIYEAAREVLVKPAQVMDFIKELATIRAKHNLPFTCRLPTGFPWHSTYYEPNTHRVTHPLDSLSVYQKAKLGVDWDEEKIDKRKARSSTAPNWTHGMDSSHLIRVRNAAARDGIKDVVGVHDSFGCLAPKAVRLRQIIGVEMSLLYTTYNVLGRLRRAAIEGLPPNVKVPEGPETGKLNLMDVQRAEYAFM